MGLKIYNNIVSLLETINIFYLKVTYKFYKNQNVPLVKC